MSDNDSEDLDIHEKGRGNDGQTISLDRRLFMQFMAFGGCLEPSALIAALEDAGISGALYQDINDPQGVALLTFSETPDFFLTTVRGLLNRSPFSELTPKPEYTMLGRTYTLGYEPDLEETLIRRPRRRVTNPEWPWAIWYPLRRAGSFEQLSAQEQRVRKTN